MLIRGRDFAIKINIKMHNTKAVIYIYHTPSILNLVSLPSHSAYFSIFSKYWYERLLFNGVFFSTKKKCALYLKKFNFVFVSYIYNTPSILNLVRLSSHSAYFSIFSKCCYKGLLFNCVFFSTKKLFKKNLILCLFLIYITLL